MIENLAQETRTLVYTMICFQCILQLTQGSTYQRYLKLLSYLIVLCICCRLLLSFGSMVEGSWSQADQMYVQWVGQWQELTQIEAQSGYLQERIEGDIIEEAQEEYSRWREEEQDEESD